MTVESSKRPRPKILVVEGLTNGEACIEAAGGTAVAVRAYGGLDVIDKMLLEGDFQGVLLTGGGDVDPRLYGETPSKHVYGVSETRDLIEMCTLDTARKLNVPVLGICRGSQIMAVEAGGKLKQHIDAHRGGQHSVFTDRKSFTRRATVRPHFEVVSLHHQEIADPGPQMRIVGWADDGTNEIIESYDGRCIGVQFHPEMDEFEDYAQNLFRWLVVEAARRAKMPTPNSRWSVLHKRHRTAKIGSRGSGGGWSSSSSSYGGTTPRPTPAGKDWGAQGATVAPPAVSRPAGTNTEPGRKSAELSLVSRFAAAAADRLTGRREKDEVPSGIILARDGGVMMHPTPGDNTVYVSYICPHCTMRFDKYQDREDHVRFGVCQRSLIAALDNQALKETDALIEMHENLVADAKKRREHPTFRSRREMVAEDRARGVEHEIVGVGI